MKFRPCIDIHNGAVKQIVGGSLVDSGDIAVDNFVSTQNGAYYGEKYKKDGLLGGHIILLNPEGSEYYIEDMKQAALALKAFPRGLQIGGGIHRDNAATFLDMGASHVIVTSYVFRDGIIDYDRLNLLCKEIGKENLVLDLSCKKHNGEYYIVTDRWQKITKEKMNQSTLKTLAQYCDEFLIHAVDVEGKKAGIAEEVIEILGKEPVLPTTYAGGIHSLEDVKFIQEKGNGKIDFTIGSALDLFGGAIPYKSVAIYK